MASDTMQSLMTRDEKIAQLSDRRVKELIVKDYVWKVFRKELRAKYGSDAFNNAEYDNAMNAFNCFNLDGFGFWLTERSGLGGPLVAQFRENGPDALDSAFRSVTTDGVDLDDCRRQLAGICNGSMGMPRDKIIRENLGRYVE